MRAVLTAAVLLAAAELLSPPAASACSRLVGISMRSPADGAEEVPINVVPWLAGIVGPSAPNVELFDSTGAPVPAEIEPVGQDMFLVDHFELRPATELTPNETYRVVITVESGEGGEHTFTTGDGPLDAPPPPLESLRMQTADNLRSSCGDTGIACVALPTGRMALVETTWDGGSARMISRSWEGSLNVPLSQFAAETPFCLEIRPRDVAGQLGEPTTQCSEDWPLYNVHVTSGPIRCRDGRLFAEDAFIDETHDSGCAVTHDRGTPAGAAIFLVLLVATLRVSCRRGALE